MKAIDDDGTELIRCEYCYNGQWETECCNGAYGCSCGGMPVDMGRCNVCGGSGWRRPDADTQANRRAMRGMLFAGSGPRGGYFGGR